MIFDLSGIVNEGFTIPRNNVHKNIFLCENGFVRVKLNCSCLIISPSELILMFEMIIT